MLRLFLSDQDLVTDAKAVLKESTEIFAEVQQLVFKLSTSPHGAEGKQFLERLMLCLSEVYNT